MHDHVLSDRNRAHVLAVDDDVSMRALITDYLGDHDITVTAVATEADMLEALRRHPVDLVVLDLRLAHEDGMQIASKLRMTSKLPIIILTGRSEEADRVMGLELGADDYLTKPFSPRELLARIRALLRRTRIHETVAERVDHIRLYRFAGWQLNLRSRQLTREDGQVITLRNGEFNLLLGFAASARQVLTRAQLLDLSRLHNDEVYDRSVDVLVGRLKKKVEVDPRHPRLIVTERGVGYVFDVDVEGVRG